MQRYNFESVELWLDPGSPVYLLCSVATTEALNPIYRDAPNWFLVGENDYDSALRPTKLQGTVGHHILDDGRPSGGLFRASKSDIVVHAKLTVVRVGRSWRLAYLGSIEGLPKGCVYQFGSNTQGRHGAGSAKLAVDLHGAEYGNPQGWQGKKSSGSSSYAIVTKDISRSPHRRLQREYVVAQVARLYQWCERQDNRLVFPAYTGGEKPNLNGYMHSEMLSMYVERGLVPRNLVLSWNLLQEALPIDSRRYRF